MPEKFIKKCTGCAACKAACPMDAIEMNEGKAQVSEAWVHAYRNDFMEP